MSNEKNSEKELETPKKKKGFGDRLITWGINLALGGALIWWIMSMQSNQEQKFYQGVVDTATVECNDNRVCLDNLKAHFHECAGDYVYKEKVGKFNKKYTLDKEGFDECLDSYKNQD